MREEKKYEILPGVELPDLKTIREAASDFSVSEVGDVDIREVTLVEPTSVEAATTAAVSPEELANLKNLGDKVAEDEAKAQAESKAKMDEIKKKAVHASESLSDLKASNMQRVIDDDKRKAIEDSLKAEQEQQAEIDAKNKAREERRLLQQRLFEEAKERAAKERAAAEDAAKKENADSEKAEEKSAEEKAEVKSEEKVEAKAEEKVEAKVAEKAVEAAPAAKEEPKEVKEESKEEPKAETKEEPAKKITTAAEVKPENFVDDKREATIASADETFDDFKEFLGDNE